MIFFKRIAFAFFVCLLFTNSFSQFVATWPFNNTAKLAGNKGGTQQANITIADAILGNAIGTTNFSNNGVKLQPPTLDWVTTPTDDWQVDFPLSPVAGNDIVITGLSFSSNLSGGNSSQNMVYTLAAEDIGNGKISFFGTPQTTTSGTGTQSLNFTGFSKKLYSGRTYRIKIYIYAAVTGTTKSKSVTLLNVTFNGNTVAAGTQPTVTTNTAIATGKYTATATGTVTTGTYSINQSGVVWDVNANPTTILTTKTTNGPTTSGIINGAISGLTAGTTYNVRAYVESETGDVFYGANKTFTTNPPTVPSLTTTPISNITSIKAMSGGTVTDSGGVGITQKGVCWNNAPNPTIANSFTIDGAGNDPYSSLIKTLTPSTNYCVRAYAKNSLGIGYGNEVCFTTDTPQAVILATTPNGQNSIVFGDVIVNASSGISTYTLQGNNLTPANGSLIITAPAGFIISNNLSAGFSSAITISYTGGFITPTTIYVKFIPSNFGVTSGVITYSGGGATAKNIDTVSVTGRGVQNPSDLSNAGTDFWTGFGYQGSMRLSPTSGDAAKMSLFVATGNQASTIVVDLPNITGSTGFPQVYNVPANTVQEISGFPIGSGNQYNSGNTPDTRLYFTGVTNRGIHIYSTNDVPFSAWMYTYTKDNSAGASMLFPTNTWGSKYTVQGYGGYSNSANPNSFFYVIAKEDSTTFEFTPSVNILDSTARTLFKESGLNTGDVKYFAGTKYTLMLNKGQVFNAMGFIDDQLMSGFQVGLDVSGTTIKSVDCNKKLAVFGGNGRVLVDPPIPASTGYKGSDNLVQQMFPRQAWGTKYFTVPTKTMEQNYFRIYADDANTLVWLNNSSHIPGNALPAASFNNTGKYFEFTTNKPNEIESDRPVSVVQYITAGANGLNPNIGNGGSGDPEMIVLSPIQQAISSANVYSANFKNGKPGGSYINIVVHKNGIANFKIDGLQVCDTGQSSFDGSVGVPGIYGAGANTAIPIKNVFNQYPIDTNYYYAKIRLQSGLSHSVSSDFDFNAIAYGMSDGESYGYNAGTHLRPLDQFISPQNPYPNTTEDSVIPTCLSNSFTYTVNLPYKPTYMKWDFFKNNIQLPGSDSVEINNPIAVDSFVRNGVKLYRYTLPVKYTFSGTGSFPVNITMNATTADSCTTTQTITFTLKVIEPPTPYFINPANNSVCGGNFFTLSDSSYDKNGYSIVGREWTFGGGLFPASSADANPNVFGSSGTYNGTLRTINSIGCYKDTSFTISIYDGPNVDSILTSQSAFCVGKTVSFTARYTPAGMQIGKFYWNFGDGTKDSSTTNTINHTYTNANSVGYTVNVYGISAKGCKGNTKTLKLPVYLLQAGYKTNSPQCVNSVISFTDTSKITNVISPFTVAYTWGFGDALNSTSNAINPTFTYNAPNLYSTWQKITLKEGIKTICTDSISQQVNITPVLLLTDISVSNNNHDCINKPVTFTANGNTASGNIKWYWSSSDGRNDTTTSNTLTRSFTATGAITISVFATINGGCASNIVSNVQHMHNLHADMNFSSPQCVNTTVNFTDASTGTINSAVYDTKYLWNFRDAANTTSVIQSPTFTYNTAGNYDVKMRVALLAGSVEFCADSITKTLVIFPNLPAPTITADALKTTTSSLTFNWTSVLNATGYQVNVNGGAWTNPSTGATGLQHVLNGLAQNTAYTVCVKPQGTCLGDSACTIATTSVENQQVIIPNTFTPNGDTRNDKFTICSNTIQSIKMIVFSQWGEKLYESLQNSPNASGNCFETWDGYAFGKPQPVGVYAYVVTITMKDGKVMSKKGLINLIR